MQRGYSREDIEALLKESGLELIEALDTDTLSEPRDDSEKLTFIAREYLKDPERPGYYKDGRKQLTVN